jgi:hypothetical protein
MARRWVGSGSRLLEEVKHVAPAIRGPEREELMVLVQQAPAAAQRDEARIPGLGQDHCRLDAFISAEGRKIGAGNGRILGGPIPGSTGAVKCLRQPPCSAGSRGHQETPSG